MSGKKREIIEAASMIVRSKGYENTKLDDIMKAANIGKVQFYYYFASKHDLGLQVLDYSFERWRQELLSEIMDSRKAPTERLEEMLKWIIRRHSTDEEKCGCIFGNLAAEMSEHDEEFRKKVSLESKNRKTSFRAFGKQGATTGVKPLKSLSPTGDFNQIFKKLEFAQKAGAMAVGMDITVFFGGKREDYLIRPNLMGPKILEELKSFVGATGLPFIFKGVLSETDAKKALEAGAAAIVVSQHGGVLIDYAVPPLKVLPKIAKVIDRKIPIFVDSGLVRGTDVFKALALGADGVLIGRSVMAGLAFGGAAGVEALLRGTNEELRRMMSLTGSKDFKNIDPSVIWQ